MKINNEQREFIQKALKILYYEEFVLFTEVNKDKQRVFRLKDQASINLGDIESEEFATLGAVLDRLNCYHGDFFDEDDAEDAELLAFLKNDDATEFLYGFTVDNYEQYNRLIA